MIYLRHTVCPYMAPSFGIMVIHTFYRFYVNWRKAVRKLFNLPYRTRNELLPYICDDVNPSIQVLRRVISFIKGLSNTQNELSALCYKLALLAVDLPQAIIYPLCHVCGLFLVNMFIILSDLYVQQCSTTKLPYVPVLFAIY